MPESDKTQRLEASEGLSFEKLYAGRNVLVTGHTGFTGGWLSLWLQAIGANVSGLALDPVTEPNLFDAAAIGAVVSSRIGDIRDYATVKRVFETQDPEIVFHLAAQPLVSRSFDDPLETFASNVMGTAHVLEAACHCESVKAVVCVTTDKVYADQNWHWGYREVDRLGGKDPYSASKAAAELVAASYQRSLAERANAVAIATARGGNILGGGDWSQNRIVPDFVRAQLADQPLVLRNPDATRPWQHVLALVHGYLTLADRLVAEGSKAATAWNFGPVIADAMTVRALVEEMGRAWENPKLDFMKGSFPETNFLHVDSSKARAELGWCPPITFQDTVALTSEWYRAFHQEKVSARDLVLQQIGYYRNRLASGLEVKG